MTDLLDKAGSGSVEPEDFNAVVDAIESGPTGKVTAADIDSLAAQDGDVLTADGAGNATWETGDGSQPIQAVYSGNAVSIANAAGGTPTFDSLDSGTELLDRTDPAAPVFLADGTYAFCYTVSCSALTPGGLFTLNAYNGATFDQVAFVALSATLPATVTIVMHAAAGDLLGASLGNQDGVASRDFNLQGAILTKLA